MKPSGILQNNLFYGETQDLALLQEDWCSPAAPLTGWQPARPSHAPPDTADETGMPAGQGTAHPEALSAGRDGGQKAL